MKKTQVRNTVPLPPFRMVIALQYWAGDEMRAMRLAKLMADVEERRRDDVVLALVRRFDTPQSAASCEAIAHCGHKFRTMEVRARREGAGHPHGSNELWASCMDQFSEAWRAGRSSAHSIFTCEADGVPLRADWIRRLLDAHKQSMDAGKRVTGPVMQHYPHINGSLIAHLSLWYDRPSLHQTPSDQGWDMFHSHVLMAEALPTTWIKNIYGEARWTGQSLFALSHETAWLASQKDDSAISWAEKNIVAGAKARRKRWECGCPDPYYCNLETCPCKCRECRRRSKLAQVADARSKVHSNGAGRAGLPA